MIRVKGWNSSGVIVTPRARDLGFEPWWKKFAFLCTHPERHRDPPRFLHDYRNSFATVKRPGRVIGYAPSSSVEVKERVDLYLNSRVHDWNIVGRHLSLKEWVNVTDDGHKNDFFWSVNLWLYCSHVAGEKIVIRVKALAPCVEKFHSLAEILN
jgi:hypothetical protein